MLRKRQIVKYDTCELFYNNQEISHTNIRNYVRGIISTRCEYINLYFFRTSEHFSCNPVVISCIHSNTRSLHNNYYIAYSAIHSTIQFAKGCLNINYFFTLRMYVRLGMVSGYDSR